MEPRGIPPRWILDESWLVQKQIEVWADQSILRKPLGARGIALPNEPGIWRSGLSRLFLDETWPLSKLWLPIQKKFWLLARLSRALFPSIAE